MSRPPLAIHVLFHPQSEDARKLALDLYRRFMSVAGAPGLRIPVAFMPVREDGHPSPVDLDAAQRTLVVLLADGRMARRARTEDRASADAWGDLAVQLLGTSRATDNRHGFLPVAADARGLSLDDRLAEISFVRLDRFDDDPAQKPAELTFHVAVAALLLLRNNTLPDQPPEQAPLQLFLSHAKVDLPADKEALFEGPVLELIAFLGQGSVDGWYDAKKIARGSNFEEAIRGGVGECDVVVGVISDHWSDREWCRREMLITKELGKPLVLVDALSAGADRLFPYLGNAQMIHWRSGASRSVVLAALLEAVRHNHALQLLAANRKPGDHLLGVQPEALTLKRLPKGTTRVVYPDPPLSNEEVLASSPLVIVESGAGPAQWTARPITVTTPLTEIARWSRPPGVDMVGLSLSGATDIEQWGASTEHLATLADDLVTMLLLAGLRLGYGGVFDHGGAKNDAINYTTRLFGLVRSYSPWAAKLAVERFHPISNFVPWPAYLGYGDEQLDRYGREAVLEEGPAPDLGGAAAELAPDARGTFKRDTPVRKWAMARGVTEMRIAMSQKLAARVALAGKLDSYIGLLPGVLEEILIARRGEFGGKLTPLFLIGAFGGVSRYAIDLIEGRPRPEATSAWVSGKIGDWPELLAEYQRRGGKITTPVEAAACLAELGKGGPAQALDNGLDDAENREMFATTDSRRIVELMLIGLGRRFAS